MSLLQPHLRRHVVTCVQGCVIVGTVAMAVLNACSGNFMAIYQYLYFDATKFLSAEDFREDYEPI